MSSAEVQALGPAGASKTFILPVNSCRGLWQASPLRRPLLQLQHLPPRAMVRESQVWLEGALQRPTGPRNHKVTSQGLHKQTRQTVPLWLGGGVCLSEPGPLENTFPSEKRQKGSPSLHLGWICRERSGREGERRHLAWAAQRPCAPPHPRSEPLPLCGLCAAFQWVGLGPLEHFAGAVQGLRHIQSEAKAALGACNGRGRAGGGEKEGLW